MTMTVTANEKRTPGRPRGRRTDYDPLLGVRVPPAVRAGLDALAKDRNKTVSVVARELLEPYQWYATEHGQHALRVIELAVGLSTTIHKGYDEFGPTATPDDWHGVPVLNVGTEEQPRYVHTVRQREGETRNQAIRKYAENVWGVLAAMTTTEQRDEELKQLRDDNAHVFVMGYVGIKRWTVFPSPVELRLYETQHPRNQGKTPTTGDEQRVYDHYRTLFEELILAGFVEHTAPATSGVVGRFILWDGPARYEARMDFEFDLREPTDEELQRQPSTNGERPWGSHTETHELKWYPDETADEGLARWARVMVARYVQHVEEVTANPTLFAMTTPDAFIEWNDTYGLFAVTPLRWLDDVDAIKRRYEELQQMTTS